jgi:hypothetical protein
MMFARGVEFDVTQEHHLVVLLRVKLSYENIVSALIVPTE